MSNEDATTRMEQLIGQYRKNNNAHAALMARIEEMRKGLAELDLQRKSIIEELRGIREKEIALMKEMLDEGKSQSEIHAMVNDVVKKIQDNEQQVS